MSDNLEVAKECGIRVFNLGGYLECTGDAFEAYTSRILALQQAAHDAEIAKLKEENKQPKLKLIGKNIAVCPHCMGNVGVLIDGEPCLICGSTGYMEAMK